MTDDSGHAAPPRRLELWPLEQARDVHTVLLDIDDTLTSHGRLRSAAYAALETLHETGVRVVPITGRPAGWCDHIARMWPVDAVVGENGAFWMWYEEAGEEAAGRLRARHCVDEARRAADARSLCHVADRILREVPGCALASDQFCRLHDLAIDFREDVAPLSREAVDRIVAIMRESGMHARSARST